MAYRGSPKWAEKRFSHVTGESHQVERRSYKMPLGKAFWALSSTLSHPSFSIRNGLGLQLSSFISLFPAYFLPVSSLKTQRPLFILNYLCSFQFKLMLLKIYVSYRSNYSLLRWANVTPRFLSMISPFLPCARLLWNKLFRVLKALLSSRDHLSGTSLRFSEV